MAKRFTDTEIWNDPWFRKLSAEGKILWRFLLDRCDVAGFWKKDFELASFQCGFDVTDSHIEGLNKGKVRVIDHGDYLEISGFIQFQYGTLSEECNPHKPIINLLKNYRNKGYVKGISTLQEKDKEKEKEKDKGGVGGNQESKPRFKAPTIAEVKAYCDERKNSVDSERFVDFYVSKGWRVGNQPMRDWKAAVRTWEKSRSAQDPPEVLEIQRF